MKKIVRLLILMAVLFTSCKKDKKKEVSEVGALEYEEVYISTEDLKFCEDKDCPQVDIQYIQVTGKADSKHAINDENQSDIVRILNQSEEASDSKDINLALKEFVSEYWRFKELDETDTAPYEVLLEQQVKGKTEQSVVLETSYYMFAGGAHGYGGVRFLNFDAETGKLLSHSDLINDIPAFTKFAEQEFRAEHEIPESSNINSTGFLFDDDKFVLPENIAVTDSVVELIYNSYEVASYAEGQLRMSFSKETVQKWFNY